MNTLKISLSVLLLGVILFFFSCSDDEPPYNRDITGNFYGTYTLIEAYGSDTAVEHEQLIEWILDDSSYYMRIDTSRAFNTGFTTCRVKGRYYLTEGINLSLQTSVPDSAAGFDECNEEYNPEGLFTLVQSNNADSLRMTQYDGTKQRQKEIYVIRE